MLRSVVKHAGNGRAWKKSRENTRPSTDSPDVEYDYNNILAVYKAMYENASKISLNVMCRNNLNKMAYIMFALPYFDVSGFIEVV